MSNSGDAAGLLQHGLTLHQSGRLDEARDVYRQVLQVAPETADAWHFMGLLLHQQGHSEQAITAMEQAIRLNSANAVFYGNLGGVLMATDRHDEAESVLRRGLEVAPKDVNLLNNLGAAFLEQQRFSDAESILTQVLNQAPDHTQALMNLGNACRGLGQLEEAARCYGHALTITPQNVQLLANLGAAQFELEQFDAAMETLERALELDPTCVEAACSLASLLQHRGDTERAEQYWRQAASIDSGRTDARLQLGILLNRQQRYDEAIAVLAEAVELRPDAAEAWHQLGRASEQLGDTDRAIDYYRTTLEYAGNHIPALNSLGNLLSVKGKLTEGFQHLSTAVECDPDSAESHNNLGCTLMMMGRADEALASLRKATEISGNAAWHSVALLCEQYQPEVTAVSLLNRHREWQAQHSTNALPLCSREVSVELPPRIRIGFLSPDFGCHPVGYFLLSCLQHLERTAFEVVCYSDRLSEDGMTSKLRATSDRWHAVRHLTDGDLAEQIVDDQVDILFDLAGHTAHNRLRVFARRVAPVQVTWAGYVGTTGLDEMDFVLADRVHVPVGEESAYSESIQRMPNGYVCYTPPDELPEVGPLPALDAAGVTFGYLGNPCKITPPVIEIWSRILRELPDARLFLKFIGMDDVGVRDHFLSLFDQHSIDAGRIEFEGRSPHSEFLDAWNRVDLALDTFPYSSGLTVLESLIMGVPMVTCPGATFAGRHASGHQSVVGLQEFIAADLDDYVSIAVKNARDTASLSALRSTLRSRLLASPLCDYKQFAADFGVACHEMWIRHVSRISQA